jgi:hypothetical protein
MRLGWVTLFSLLTTHLFCQEYPTKDVDVERIVEEIYGVQDLDLNYEELYENLLQFLNNPININRATTEQLRFLHILSEYQLEQLAQYKKDFGELQSLFELQAIPGFDSSTITKLIPFITISGTPNTHSIWNRIRDESSTYLLLRYDRLLETKKGFMEPTSERSRFHGNEDRYYARFRSSKPGDFSFGFTLEKDAGEDVIWNPSKNQYGSDFVSFHAQLQNKGHLKNLIIGDFQPQFGQGIALGGSFGFGKGAETVLTTRRSNVGFIPYTSVTEYNYLHGIASTLSITKQITLSSFYSNRKLDAATQTDSSENTFITSLQTTGLHRSDIELEGRKSTTEETWGVILNYQRNNIESGILFSQSNFDRLIQPTASPYNQFAFRGSQNTLLGGYLNITIHNATFFTEFSQRLEFGNAMVAGMLVSLTPKLDVALHYRNYQRNFISHYSNAFAESSTPQNERGVYWGWKYRFNKMFSTAGYVDLFQFPWLRYRSYKPGFGHEWLIRVNYEPSKKILIYTQIREELKERNIASSTSNLYNTLPGVKRNFWMSADYAVTPSLRLKTRAQFSTYTLNDVTTQGMMLSQDASWEFGKFAISARHALLHTDDFDNRQYVYERDVWLAFSLPAYAGVGIRNYLLIQYNVSKTITLWVRYSRFNYNDRNEIGSGVDTIKGNTKNDIKFQLRIKL